MPAENFFAVPVGGASGTRPATVTAPGGRARTVPSMPTLLAVDGNSLLHRAYHAHAGTNMRDSDGNPTWALHGFLRQLASVIEKVGPDAIIVGFDQPGCSLRKDAYPPYKANRGEKAPELATQILLAHQLLADAGMHVVIPDGLEADDILAASAKAATAAGWDTVVVTSDRDSFALISATTSVLRILNGGVANSPTLTPASLPALCGVRPDQYRDYAAMRGDTSDNLPGMMGIGPKGAAAILAAYGSVAAALAAVADDPAAAGATIGKANATKLANPDNQHAWKRNVTLMGMLEDTPTHLNFGPTCPSLVSNIVEATFRAACDRHNLRAGANAMLAALTGPKSPAPSAWDDEPAWDTTLAEEPVGETDVAPESARQGSPAPRREHYTPLTEHTPAPSERTPATVGSGTGAPPMAQPSWEGTFL